MPGPATIAIILAGALILVLGATDVQLVLPQGAAGPGAGAHGLGGVRVSFSGMVYIPMMHVVEAMDISVKRVEIERAGKNGLICRDNLRADIKVAFFARVNGTEADALRVAQSVGCQGASDIRALFELLDAKFSEALKTVGKKFDFVELYTERERFKNDIIDLLGRDLNRYVLEDAAIDYPEQTPQEVLSPDNILDAEGIKKITDLTAQQLVLANNIERDKEKTITKQNLEAQEAILELNRQLAEKEEIQRREIASIKAREEAETARIQQEEGLKAENARIRTDEELAVAGQNKDRQIIVATRAKERTHAVETERVARNRALEVNERERIVTLAQIEKEKDVEEERKNIQDVIRERERLAAVLSGAGRVLAAFPEAQGFEGVRADLAASIASFCEATKLFSADLATEDAEHLFLQVAQGGPFVVLAEAAHLHSELLRVVREARALDDLEKSLAQVESDLVSGVRLVRGWVSGFLRGAPARLHRAQAAALPPVPGAKAVAARLREEMRLGDFEPRVLTSFVRNRLADEVYLPLVGDNLAKQVGAAGARKRTDLMGMLLLISPPGYGKTTLVGYVASQLGLVFAKINGPAIGHEVTSLDPADAPNAAAAQEVRKLNLALEMGDNVMIYVDDIQHCHPGFLQKFISLCDGQRRIEGVWRARSRTYDLRGRKVCVVMAGNPYTESGEKFKIPDMLADRADTCNLGDIIGDNRAAFEETFIENVLTSNAVLSPLHARSRQDVKSVLRLARGEDPAGIELESPMTSDELADATAVLRHLVMIQSIPLKVNK